MEKGKKTLACDLVLGERYSFGPELDVRYVFTVVRIINDRIYLMFRDKQEGLLYRTDIDVVYHHPYTKLEKVLL